MSEKEIAQIEDSIIQARKEGLLKATDSTMQSHGKLWGMDVFSWINPKPEVLAATMDSFPFPIIWISSMVEKENVLTEKPNLLGKIHYSIEINSNQSTNALVVKNVKKVSSITEAFEEIQRIKIKPSILLFSYANSDWEYQINRFKDYLFLVQIK
jgi:hypothetical protein